MNNVSVPLTLVIMSQSKNGMTLNSKVSNSVLEPLPEMSTAPSLEEPVGLVGSSSSPQAITKDSKSRNSSVSFFMIFLFGGYEWNLDFKFLIICLLEFFLIEKSNCF